MPRLIDVITSSSSTSEAISGGEELVAEHLICVAYIISVWSYYRNDEETVENADGALLILKARDDLFHSNLLPRVRQLGMITSIVLPAVDVAEDYNEWVFSEIHE